MLLDQVLQQVVNGLVAGSTYALIGLGLSLVYGVMELTNFAHGEFAMIGGFVTYFLVVHYGGSYLLAIVLAGLVAAVIGVVVDLVAFYPLRRSNPLNLMLSSLGVSIVLVNVAQYFFTPDPRRVDTPFTSIVYQVGPVSMNLQRILAMIIGLGLAFATYQVVQHTRFGKALRAASQDTETALLYGINTDRIALATFGLGALLAGIAGALLGPIFYVYPVMGIPATLKAFVVVVLGGMGNVFGAIAGGLVVGLVESLGSLISTAYKDLFVYLILILVLILKPHGLFRRYQEEKV